MSSATALILVLAGCAGLSLIVSTELLYRLRRKAISDRIRNVAMAGMAVETGPAEPGPFDKLAVLADNLLDILAGEPVWPRKMSAIRVLGTGILAGILIALFLKFLMGLPWGGTIPVALSSMIAVPITITRSEQRQRAAHFEAIFADTIDMIVRMLRAGKPITVAIARVAREAQPPADGIYREATEWLNMGMPLDKAMQTVAARIKLPDFDFFAAALAIQNTVGGNLTETLENLASIIRERSVSVLKARAITSQARMTSHVILSILPALIVMLQIAKPSYILPLVNGTHGYGLIIFIIISYIVAVVVIRNLIARVKVS